MISKLPVSFVSKCSHLDSDDQFDMESVCLVGIGNPLHSNDSIGLKVVSALEMEKDLEACFINIESHINVLSNLVGSHKTIVILDTVSNLKEEDGLFLEIDQETLSTSNQSTSSSHGLSWMKELQLLDLDNKNVFFLGVSANIEEHRIKFCVSKLQSLLKEIIFKLKNDKTIDSFSVEFLVELCMKLPLLI